MQDWTAATSITDFVWDHDLEEVAFEYTPNVDGPTLTGTVRVEVPAETYGGDVNTRITSDFEWFIIGDVTRTPAAVHLRGADRRPVEGAGGGEGPAHLGHQGGVDRAAPRGTGPRLMAAGQRSRSRGWTTLSAPCGKRAPTSTS